MEAAIQKLLSKDIDIDKEGNVVDRYPTCSCEEGHRMCIL